MAKPQVTVLRDEIEPGSEAQIDYGRAVDRPAVRQTPSGLGTRDGPAVLAHVRPAGAAPGPVRMDGSSRHSFRYFGGGPRRPAPDNLKTGVDKPDLYDPKINRG